MKAWQQGLLAVLLAAAAACDTGTGPNSLYKFQPATGCTACHSSAVSPTLDPLVTNGSGSAGKHVRHVQNGGIACERCHSGYDPAATHMNGTFDTANPAVRIVLFDSSNPTGTWTNDTGPGTGTCASVSCHGGVSLDWYAAGLPACAACHVIPMGPRRAVMGAGGDFASNPSVSSHHVSGASDPAPEQCQVCHEMSQHMSGTVRLKNADGGAAIIYSSATPSTAEQFCLSCHDADGALITFTTVTGGTAASPFNDGSVMGAAPNRASAEIAGQWSKTYGHKQKGLTCIGNGTPNTGCHGNGHGTGNVGLLARNLTLPSAKTDWYAVTDEPDYDLCFSCHASYPLVTKEAVLGMKTGGKYALDLAAWGVLPAYAIGNIQTLFRDVNLGTTGKAYDDAPYFNEHENLHMFHLQIGPAWSYRDAVPSSIVCLSCHSVHGSDTRWGWVHDSLQFSHVSGAGGDQYGMIGAAPLSLLGNYPTSCTFNCHDIFGTTHSWFEPSDE